MSAQVAADLRAAAEVLRRDGWTQGAFREMGRCCATGAIVMAVSGGHVFQPYGMTPVQAKRWARTGFFLSEFLGGRSVTAWNDTPGRTAVEVIAALEAAAAVAEAQQ